LMKVLLLKVVEATFSLFLPGVCGFSLLSNP